MKATLNLTEKIYLLSRMHFFLLYQKTEILNYDNNSLTF